MEAGESQELQVSQQAGDSGEPVLQSLSGSEGLRPRRAMVWFLPEGWLAGWRPRESGCRSSDLKTVWPEEFSVTWGKGSLFVLFRPLTDWMRPAHTREGNPLSLVY